jgi:hypothetical protein
MTIPALSDQCTTPCRFRLTFRSGSTQPVCEKYPQGVPNTILNESEDCEYFEPCDNCNGKDVAFY